MNLAATGALELRGNVRIPKARPAQHQLWRRVGGTGDFAFLAGVGAKKFTDNTVPAGSSQVTYQVQAVRSTAVGEFAQFNVNFGVSGGTGAMTAFVTESAPAKLAA